MKRTPFSSREHLAAGAMLSRIDAELWMLTCAVNDAYGVIAAAGVSRLMERLMKIRSALDEKVCGETPRGINEVDGGVPVTRVYYGWERGPKDPVGCLTVAEARAELRRRADHVFDAGNPWADRRAGGNDAEKTRSKAGQAPDCGGLAGV